MFEFILTVAAIIASIIAWQTIFRTCRAIVTMSCATDHGHGNPPTLQCYCRCHVPKS